MEALEGQAHLARQGVPTEGLERGSRWPLWASTATWGERVRVVVEEVAALDLHPHLGEERVANTGQSSNRHGNHGGVMITQ